MPLPSPAANSGQPLVRRARALLGTRVEISVSAPLDPQCLHAAIDAAFHRIEAIQGLLSYHDSSSDLSRLNRDAKHAAQRVSVDTWRVFETALRFAASSDGAFDPCIAPQLEAWGYLPPGDSLQHSPGMWREIELLNDELIRYHRPVRVDLGGIAKGYAVDQAVHTLRAAGMQQIVVNAGGDLRIAGARSCPVQLRHPQSPALQGCMLDLENASLATSAAYYSRRLCQGVEVCALLNPASGAPYLDQRSVSVKAADCMTADALTKVILFGSRHCAERVLSQFNAQAYVMDPASAIAA